MKSYSPLPFTQSMLSRGKKNEMNRTWRNAFPEDPDTVNLGVPDLTVASIKYGDKLVAELTI